jgi:hypothetical protein
MIKQNGGNHFKIYAKDSHLKDTCDIIYQHHRRRKLEKKYLNLILFFISIVMSIGTILVISFVNYDEVFAARNDRIDYLNSTHQLCGEITYGVIDLISTPIALALLIFYIILYKRRVFLKDKFKYNNIGLPMIVTSTNKRARFYTAMVYGLIALNIFEIVLSTLDKKRKSDIDIKKINDPTDIVKLLFRIAQVIFVGISMKIIKYFFTLVH